MKRIAIGISIMLVLISSGYCLDVGQSLKSTTKTYNTLAVVLSAVTTGTVPFIKGYYIYVKDGEEIKRKIERHGGWGWTFRGDYIKEVKIQKVSGDGSFQLFVMENKVTIFESDPVKTDELVIFSAKEKSF